MKLLLSLFCFFYCLTGFAQKKKPVIEFCPICLVDEISFPTIQAGVSFYFSDRFSLYNEVGVKYRKGYYEDSDTSFIGSRGIKLKTEFRYNIFKTNKFLKNSYVAFNIFYNNETHNTTIGYYFQKDSLKNWVDGFGVKKSVIGFNLLLGWKKNIWNKFSFNPYVGLGLRFVNISTVSKEFNRNRDYLQQPIDVTVVGLRNGEDANEKARNNFNLTLGIRLCYQF
jgi:hypothetical protein